MYVHIREESHPHVLYSHQLKLVQSLDRSCKLLGCCINNDKFPIILNTQQRTTHYLTDIHHGHSRT